MAKEKELPWSFRGLSLFIVTDVTFIWTSFLPLLLNPHANPRLVEDRVELVLSISILPLGKQRHEETQLKTFVQSERPSASLADDGDKSLPFQHGSGASLGQWHAALLQDGTSWTFWSL